MSSKKTKLWSSFHKIRTQEPLHSMWKILLTTFATTCDPEDPLLKQSVFQLVYEKWVCDYLAHNHFKVDSSGCQEVCVNLPLKRLISSVMLVDRLPSNCSEKHEKKAGNVASQYVHCLGEMAAEREGENVLVYTRKWLKQVNRGGLYPISNETFSFLSS